MENNIPTLYILELDSFVVKSAKMSTILCPFVQKKNNRVFVLPWFTWRKQSEPAFSVEIIQNTSCWNIVLKQCLEITGRGCCRHVFLVFNLLFNPDDAWTTVITF